MNEVIESTGATERSTIYELRSSRSSPARLRATFTGSTMGSAKLALQEFTRCEMLFMIELIEAVCSGIDGLYQIGGPSCSPPSRSRASDLPYQPGTALCSASCASGGAQPTGVPDACLKRGHSRLWPGSLKRTRDRGWPRHGATSLL